MKTTEIGVLEKSDLYFATPSPIAKKLYFYPVSAGHFYCVNGYHVVRKIFKSILVLHIVDGTFTYIADDIPVTAYKGDTVILNCFKPHEYYTDTALESLWVHINGQNCEELYNEIVKKNSNIIKSGNNSKIRTIIQKIFSSIENGKIYSESEMSLDIYALLTEITNPVQSVGKDSVNELADEAIAYIEKHLNEKLSVTDIAKAINISPSHFSRLFKSQTGYSPYDYVLVARLNKAKDYLQNTDMTVSQIAYEVGFNSDTNFSFFFKTNTGISPNSFRKLKF